MADRGFRVLTLALSLIAGFSLLATGQDSTDPPPDVALASPSFFRNNTSACSAAGYGLLGKPYCAAPFPNTTWFDEVAGWSEEQNIPSGQQIITSYHNPSPAGTFVSGVWNGLWNISKGRTNKLDMDSLMYGAGATNATTKVVVELQSWFCVPNYFDAGTGCATGSPYTPQQGVNEGTQSQQIAENDGHAGRAIHDVVSAHYGRANRGHLGSRWGGSGLGLVWRAEFLS